MSEIHTASFVPPGKKDGEKIKREIWKFCGRFDGLEPILFFEKEKKGCSIRFFVLRPNSSVPKISVNLFAGFFD